MAPPENLSVSPTSPPIVTPYDLTTLNILGGAQNAAAAKLETERANHESASVSAEKNPSWADQVQQLTDIARAELTNFDFFSDEETANLASELSVASYFDSPRITAFSSQFVTSTDQTALSLSMDLMADSIQAIAQPGQSIVASMAFADSRGFFDSVMEDVSLPLLPGSQNLSSYAIIQQAVQQGVHLPLSARANLSLLQTLNLPADAIARITTSVQNGLLVIVPTKAVVVNGTQATAWFDLDPTTGEIISESQGGSYQSIVEYEVDEVNQAPKSVTLDTSLGRVTVKLDPAELQVAKKQEQGLTFGQPSIWDLVRQAVDGTGLPAAEAANAVTLIIRLVYLIDPPVPSVTTNLDLPFPTTPGRHGQHGNDRADK